MRGRIFLAAAGLSGAISVATDAIARHLLAGDAHRFELAATSARYGLVHAAALVGVAVLSQRDDSGFCLRLSGWLFVAGLVVFCGSLDLTALGVPSGVAALAPWGGTALIAGWAALLVAALMPRR
jgi:uncharacterized membrane protein YgdD (TMEM256/DUF423 family)